MSKNPKILLLLPPAFLYPMGAAYVAATLENAGYDYDIYGFFYDNRAWFKRNLAAQKGTHNPEGIQNKSARVAQDALFEIIAQEKYDYILAGGLIGFFRWFYQILPQIKGYNPNCKIIMGGGITKDLPENTIFDKLDVDYILKGEAETNLVELLSILSQGNPNLSELLKVPGLCWKDSTSAIRKNHTVRLDLEKTTILPAWDSFHIHEYISLSDTLLRFNQTFFPVLAGRGCPNVCAFCSPSVGTFLPCSVDSVIAEMKHWLGKYEFDFFFLYSEVAFNDESYTREFCRKYKEEINKPWVGQLRTDVHFSVETYRAIKEAGCMFICMGFESASDRVLKVMNKQTTFSDHSRNMTQAKEAGLTVAGNFMFGHESETTDEIRETFNFLNQHDLINGPSNGLASIIIYPGTGYYRTAEKTGLIDDPFKFLLSYSMKAGISSVDIREKLDGTKLNISALSNNDYYDLICTENIKHRRLYSQKHAAVDVVKTFELGSEAGFVYQGKCSTCGKPIKFNLATSQSPFNIIKVCDGCYYTSLVDIYQFPENKSYLEEIKSSIMASKKIVVYGSWIMDLMFSGSVSIPYEKIIAWVDPENPESSNFKYFYHIPQISLADLKEYDYDVIITLKPRALATPCIIGKNGLDPAAKIINPIPALLNAELEQALGGKSVAIVGESDLVAKLRSLLLTEVVEYSSLKDIFKQEVRHDFIIFDPNEFDVVRTELAQNSRYLIHEILHVQFLLDGGYFPSTSLKQDK